MAANCTRGFAPGKGLPSSRSRSGLGSKVSMCDGPPFMKRKMTRLARGATCGGFADAGEGDFSASKEDAASQPKPTAERWSAARRLRSVGSNAGFMATD